jgi:NAD(P)-dependent dehydrogenase (short-subunit alcohol dehydrogenase family)
MVRVSRVILVTGGSRGIGAATALAAAEAGYAIGVVYRERAESAERVVADCVARGTRALAVRADVSVEADVERAFAEVEQVLGPVIALVNNAGIVARQARVVDLDAARIERLLRVNVLGAFLCAREAVRRMSTARGGHGGAIVNVSSRAAVLGSAGEYVDYAASKAALDALTVGLAAEVAREGIRVNGVRPGLIHTEMHADGGEPDRVARMAPGVPMGRGGEPRSRGHPGCYRMRRLRAHAPDVSGGR